MRRHQLPLFIAWRYLFTRKRFNVINIVTIVSALAICVVAMAMICVLSIYNGYQQLILGKVERLDPELLISHPLSKTIDYRQLLSSLRSIDGVSLAAPIVRGEGLVSNDSMGTFTAARLYGIDSLYLRVTQIEEEVYDGRLSLYPGQYNIGSALAMNLNSIPGDSSPLTITLPRRSGYISPVVPATSMQRASGNIVSVIYSDNVEYDNTLFLPIDELRSLLSIDRQEAHAIALKVAPSADIRQVKHAVQRAIGDELLVQDRAEQQPHIIRLVSIEKWISFLIFAFILFLAAYNVMASISMLLISKRHDIELLDALGTQPHTVRQIFRLEGLLITLLGAIAGTMIGLLLCYLQMRFGWLTIDMVSGSEPYPVLIRWGDILWVLLLVLLVGYAAAYYPVHRLLRQSHEQA